MSISKDYVKEARRLSKAAQADPNITPRNLVLRNLALPVSMARNILRKTHFHDPGEAVEELVAVANMTLVRVANAYEMDKAKANPGEFTAYAMAAIERDLWAAVSDMRTGGAGSGQHARRNIYPIRAELARRRREGLKIDVETIASKFGLLPDTARGLIALADGIFSLDIPKVDADGKESLTYGEALPDDSDGPEEATLQLIESEERAELTRAVEKLPDHYRVSIAFATGFKSFDSAVIGDVIRASGKSTSFTARQNIVRLFQRGQANAERIGYTRDQATGLPPGQGLSKGLAQAGKSTRKQRDNPADIWRRVTDRWRNETVGTG